jgi:UDP-N-acetyl-2-amino-2-deoxyglucuronate dehydrogenase
MKKTGIGIIGTGAIAGKHADAIKELDNGELIAMCSSNPERARSATSKYQIKTYSDISDFLKHPGLDIVCICTASGQHYEPTIQAANAGKHVIVEKPIEINLERADKMIQTCSENGVKFGVIFQNRFNPEYIKIKNAIKEGKLGKLLMGNAYVNWFRDEAYYNTSPWKGTLKGDGGGALINQAIHTIDLLLDCMGEVQSVFGKTSTLYHSIEGEDTAAAMVNFSSGAMGTITASTAIYPGYPERLEIYGTKGSVILEGGKITAWNIQGESPVYTIPSSKPSSGASDPMSIGHQWHMFQYRDFLNAIIGERDPLVSGEEGKKSLKLITAIYESSREGRVVFF